MKNPFIFLLNFFLGFFFSNFLFAALSSSVRGLELKQNNGKTDLHLAVEHGDLKSFREILEKQEIGVNTRDFSLSTPFHSCALQKNRQVLWPMMKLLLERKANPHLQDWMGRSPLLLCLDFENVSSLGFLLRGEDLDPHEEGIHGDTCLHYAARWFFLAVKILLGFKADPEKKNIFGERPYDLVSPDKTRLRKLLQEFKNEEKRERFFYA